MSTVTCALCATRVREADATIARGDSGRVWLCTGCRAARATLAPAQRPTVRVETPCQVTAGVALLARIARDMAAFQALSPDVQRAALDAADGVTSATAAFPRAAHAAGVIRSADDSTETTAHEGDGR